MFRLGRGRRPRRDTLTPCLKPSSPPPRARLSAARARARSSTPARRPRRLRDPLRRREGAGPRPGRDRRRHGRLRVPAGAPGDEPRAPRRAPRGAAAQRPGTTVNRFCASSCRRSAWRSTRSRRGRRLRGRRRRVDHAGRRLPEGRGGAAPKLSARPTIVDVMVGCGFPQERQGMNLARRAALLAGLPHTRAGHDRQPLLRVQPPDDPHGLPRDQGRGGRRLRGRRRRVDHAGRRLPQGRRGAAPAAVRRRRADRQRLHPDGHDRGERGRAVRRVARRHGPLRPALAGARGRRAGQRLLRPRDHALPGERQRGLPRRRPAPRVDARAAAEPRPGLQAGRLGHGRQLVPAERRRGRGASS